MSDAQSLLDFLRYRSHLIRLFLPAFKFILLFLFRYYLSMIFYDRIRLFFTTFIFFVSFHFLFHVLFYYLFLFLFLYLFFFVFLLLFLLIFLSLLLSLSLLVSAKQHMGETLQQISAAAAVMRYR